MGDAPTRPLDDRDVARLREIVVGEDTFDRRFEILGETASGGMSRVFEAVDRGSDRRVAIKLLLAGADRARFAAEAEILERLDHPAIVDYVRHGLTVGGVPYLAMEWLAGETLAQRLERGGVPIAEACALGERIAGAIAHANRHNVIHRDIKPSNIFLVDGDLAKAKLIDFGIARAGDSKLTLDGQIVGTPGYMAPEQVRGDRADRRVDLFALGCVLYEAIAGRPPFEGGNVMEVLARLLLEKPPVIEALVPEVPPRLAHLIAALLAKEPSKRVSDASLVHAELVKIRDGIARGDADVLEDRPQAIPVQSIGASHVAASGSASASAHGPRTRQRRRTRRWLIGATALVLVLGGALALRYALAGDDEPGPCEALAERDGCQDRCESGDALACKLYGEDVFVGAHGQRVDKMLGIAKLTYACEHDLPKACNEAVRGISEALTSGDYRAPRDKVAGEVDRLLQLGCTDEYPLACHTLGQRLTPTRGNTRADPDRAIALESKACAKDNRDACTALRMLIDTRAGSEAARAKGKTVYLEACNKKLVVCSGDLRPPELALVEIASDTAQEVIVDGQETLRVPLPTRLRLAIGNHKLIFVAGAKRCEHAIVVAAQMPPVRRDCK